MAGVKGRSGGARPGAGRKPAPPKKRKAKAFETDDPDEFLRAVMRDSNADFKDRMAAALALKKGGKLGAPMGKREAQQAAAQAVVDRSLAPVSAPTKARPKLVAVK
jgi:phage terminase small subunit